MLLYVRTEGIQPSRANPYEAALATLDCSEEEPLRMALDDLVLSVRTVDHHVESIIWKVGVRTRAQTRPAAEALGLSGHGRQT